MTVRQQLALAFNEAVVLHEVGDDLLVGKHDDNAMRLEKPDKLLKGLLANLTTGGMTADQLCDAAADQDHGADLARLYYAIAAFEKKGFIRYTLVVGQKKWATLEPTSSAFHMQEASASSKYRLSRFACLHRLDDETLLESPLGHARVFLHDSQAAAAVALLAAPRTAAELAAELPMLDAGAAVDLISLLCSAGAAFICSTDGSIAEDDSVSLKQWEFHDLYFHHRSRSGRHGYPLGSSYRFRDTLAPLPAVKPPTSARRIILTPPDMEALAAGDVSFSRVSEARQSIRNPGERPLSLTQLGDFLYRSARVKRISPVDTERGAQYERSWRVCANGGSVHELELYLTVFRCDGIAPGLYHYDPLGNALEHVADMGLAQQALLADGCSAAGMQATDVLITYAARFQRTSWKYQSLAYALTLKNVGALYQQMYLVATAMNLAPCGLGGGNSERFAEATGLDQYVETSVGEFLLSSR